MKIFFIVSLMYITLTAQILPSDRVSTDAGQKLYQRCAGCHGTYGEKKALGKSAVINTLSKELLVTALKGYQDGTYGAEMKALMKGQVMRYSSVEIEQLAEYIASLDKSDIQEQCKKDIQPTILKKTVPTEQTNGLYVIKIKAKRDKNNIVHAKTLLKHTMLTVEMAQRIGIKQELLTRIIAMEKDQIVFDLKTSGYLSKNPVLKFKYQSTGARDLRIEAVDNFGIKNSSSVTINESTSTMIGTENTQKDKESYQVKLPVIKDTFGDIELIDTDRVQLVAPEIASNGGAVPISIRSSIKAKSVTLFAKQEQAKMKFICQWRMHGQSIIEYDLNIKLNSNGSIWNSKDNNLKVVIEAEDGKFYTTEKQVRVALGGGEA